MRQGLWQGTTVVAVELDLELAAVFGWLLFLLLLLLLLLLWWWVLDDGMFEEYIDANCDGCII